MTTPVMPSKSVFFSSIQIASFVSIAWIMVNILLKPFDLSIGELSHEEITALSVVLLNGYVMIQRLKPQSRLYFIKQKVDEIAEVISDAQEQDNAG